MSTVLNPLLFPLHGVRLIEASAGTGKTYTIANLYLRLLLGHGNKDEQGNPTAHPRALGIDEILVVTFTEAATSELRDRIRKRIYAARMDFIAGKSHDPFTQSLITSLDYHEQVVQLLQNAERQMDEAAIFTIHGFCQRMLKQHAFESGSLFSSELITDERSLLKESAADFWRRTLYPLEKALVSLAKKLWPTPDSLLNTIHPWLNKANLSIKAEKIPISLSQFRKQYIVPILALKKLWLNDIETIHEQITYCGLKSNSKTLTRLPSMEAFIQSDDLLPAEGWELYSTSVLQKSLKKGKILPVHPIFLKIDQFLDTPISLENAFKGLILKDALASVKKQLQEQKNALYQLSFDDLLRNLSAALTSKQSSTLAAAVRKQYRIAMIDEFQDTDPQQYFIFHAIYSENQDNNTGLFMIGDPKQAIYAFRGADIFTYMKARKKVNSHYTLNTNWRSSSSMVDAVNHIFSHSPSPFIYDNDIPFYPVIASQSAQQKRLTLHGNAVSALQIWLQQGDDKPTVDSGNYLKVMGTATAIKINHMLTLANQQHCLITNGETNRSLTANDIAILVRTRKQAQLIQDCLTQQGIDSVYLSNSDSVFNCQEALDIDSLLSACLHPTHARTLRAALAAPMFGLDAAYFDKLNNHEQLWETTVEEFRNYQTIWFEKGILPMLRTVIYQRKIAETLLANKLGERQLTDLLHVGELLAAKELELDSHHALQRWLAESIKTPNQNATEQQLHLESEQDLVKIITIHKSKGLEYNVVFLPFICHWKEEKHPIYHNDKNHQIILDLENNPQTQTFADKERLAEDLRLLYVALTRSIHTCFIGIAPFNAGRSKGEQTELHRSAIGWLLNKGQSISAKQLPAILEKLATQQPVISIEPVPTEILPRYTPLSGPETELRALPFNSRIEKDWWVTSYSALSRHSLAHEAPLDIHPDASMETAGYDNEATLTATEYVDEKQEEHNPYTLFHFPRGTRPGTFFHTLFERVDFSINCDETLESFVLEQLLLEGYEDNWSKALCLMIKTCLQTPLDGDELYLGKIPVHQRKMEMEFYLPISKLNAPTLNRLMMTYDPLSQKAGLLNFQQIRGILKGFIDLIFEHNGQWYILDYKSNWLGSRVEDYSREKMAAAIIDHRYDLQYQLYSLALHRLLNQRIPDYNYDRHFGGVIYLFLRGVTLHAPERHGIFNCRPKKQLIEAIDQLFTGQQEFNLL